MSAVHPLFESLIRPVRPPRVFVEIPMVEAELTINALKACASIIDKDRPADAGPSLLVRQLHSCIHGLSFAVDK